MNKIIPLILLIALAGCASQGRRARVDSLLAARGTELAADPAPAETADDSPKPSPTRALVHSMALPGAGYYYVSGHAADKNSYALKGTAFLVAEVAAFLFAQKQYKDNPKNGMLFLVPAALKLFEFDQVVADAERERAANLKRKP